MMVVNIINSIKSVFGGLFAHINFKTIGTIIAAFFVATFDPGTREVLLALTLLGCADFAFAILSLIKRKQPPRSSRFLKKAIDLVLYWVLVYVGSLLNTALGVPTTYGFDDLIAGWFAATEGLSILEHAGELGYKIPLPIFDKIKKTRDDLLDKAI